MNCYECVKNLNAEDAVQCDGCKRHLCITCSGLTSSEMKVMGLKTKRTMLFLCPPCREGLFQVPILIKSVEQLRQEVVQLREKLTTTVASESNVNSDASEILEEMAERERRSCNIVLGGVPESESTETAIRQDHDLKIVTEVITGNDMGVQPSDILKVVRLGKKGDKSRLLKVIMKSRNSAVKVLKNRSKLSKPFFAFGDQTPKQRKELLTRREELNTRLADGETDLTIKFVKGVPKIIKVKN